MTLMESVVPFTANILVIDGEEPILFVVTNTEVFEFAVVQEVPESALNVKV